MENIDYIKKEYIEYFENRSTDFGIKISVILTEMSSNWANKEYSSLVVNIRTILNIIPTVLGYASGNTTALSSQAPSVSQSEKEIITNLNSIARKWGDGINHDKETLGFEQVGLVSPAINILLAVVIRISNDPVIVIKIKESLESSEEQNTFKAIKDFFLSVDESRFKEIFAQKVTTFTCNLTESQNITLQQIANTALAKEILSFESNGNFIWNDPMKGPQNGFNFNLKYLK